MPAEEKILRDGSVRNHFAFSRPELMPSKFSFLLDPGVPEVNRGGKQAPLFASGNECLNGSFPHLDVIRRAFVMDSVLPPGIL
jgi:hypothetical protein